MKPADFYDFGCEGLIDNSIQFTRNDFRVVLLQKGYVFHTNKHRVFADLAPFVNGVSDTITGKKVVSRQARADDSYVLAQREVICDSVAVYQHGGEMRLLLWSMTPPSKPVAGQRVDIPWPDGLVFTL
jgi:hypothetical protein